MAAYTCLDRTIDSLPAPLGTSGTHRDASVTESVTAQATLAGWSAPVPAGRDAGSEEASQAGQSSRKNRATAGPSAGSSQCRVPDIKPDIEGGHLARLVRGEMSAQNVLHEDA